ncbi:hypothetical protein GW17_00036579 [Ensete ventricosum]|nr:hypothetical protein GW17_00036579 [Ensete ventricosum]RZR88491.1 hypothetical protein BHM03_00016074 [Ensete ventricosum]
MTKQNVVPAEAVAAITAGATVASSSPLYPYPPPRSFQKKYVSQLDFAGGMIGTWVESMKASSPTHTKAVPAIGAPVDEQSAAWIVSAVPHRFVSWLQSAGLLILLSSDQMRYPSALTKFEQITSASKGKQIVMFLDYDGTLSPIVEDPDSAFMTDAVNPSLFSYLLFHCPLLKDDISIVFLLLWRRQMRAAVRNVARYFPTAIVTGRCLEKVIDFVGLTELYYAGSHGMDIKGPAKPRHTKAKAKSVLFQPAREFLPMIDGVGSSSQLLSINPQQPLSLLTCSYLSSGLQISAGENQIHGWRQGGEQQVLRVCPLQMCGRKAHLILHRLSAELGCTDRAGEVCVEGVPQTAADTGKKGERIPSDSISRQH